MDNTNTELDLNDLYSAFNELKYPEKKLKSGCMQCGGNHFVHTNDGDVVCEQCGSVSGSGVIDDGAEWSSFSAEGSERCEYNNNTLLHSENMSTQIAYKRNMKNSDWNLMKWQRTIQLDPKDRTLIKVYTLIENKCVNHNINQSTINATKYLYKFISSIKLTRGAVREAMLSSCLYYAFIHENNPRNIDEVAKVFGANPKKINTTNKILSHYLWHSRLHRNVVIHTTESVDIVHRFCNKMNINSIHVSNIIDVAEKYEKNPFMSGKDCSYTVAVAMYQYCIQNNIHISKDDICETCFLSTVTLNKLLKQMK